MRALAPSRRTTRIAGLIGACTLAIVALSGCIKVDADVTVSAEATGTGTFAFELQKEAAGFLGISDLETFRSELIDGELSADSGLGVFDQCETSESDTGFVYTCSFTDATFTDPDEGPWTIAKDGDSIVFTMASDAQGDAAATGGDDLLGDASLGSINVDVTFPGAITSITGEGGTKTSDTTATVSGSLTDTINVTITSEAGSSGLTVSALLVVLLAVAVVALIVIVAIVLLMRRRGSTDSAEEAAVAEAEAAAETAVVVETVDSPTEVVETVEVTEVVETVDAPTEVVETVEVTEVAEVAETIDAPTEAVETVETVDQPATDEGSDPETPRPPA